MNTKRLLNIVSTLAVFVVLVVPWYVARLSPFSF
jgi:hypothetical protein